MFKHPILDLLQAHTHPSNGNDTRLYKLDDLRTAPGVMVVEPISECYVAVRHRLDDVIVNFAAFEWNTEMGGDVYVSLIFCGEGTGSALRELRHTNWNPDDSGYIFYMPLAKTIAALEVLKTYFDD